MQRLKQLYNHYAGKAPQQIVELPGAGSSRRYFRLGPDPSVIGTIGTQQAENEAFIYLTQAFEEIGLPVPELLASTPDGMAYLQSDLGNETLYDLIHTLGSDSPRVKELLKKTIDTLAQLHNQLPEAQINFNECYPRPSMDRRAVMWDLNYFKYCFLKNAGVEIDEDRLEDDFLRLAEMVEAKDGQLDMMLRDCQSRNIMIVDDSPVFIDYQGARRGPGLYDVVSLLWQPRANYPMQLRLDMARRYWKSTSMKKRESRTEFLCRLHTMALFRLLQVLGAYGFRGLVERKSIFLTQISRALGEVSRLLDKIAPDRFTYLTSLLAEVASQPRFASSTDACLGLTVSVQSFSYKKGIPEDFSGNGGGFVFDCRAVHNPGRYDRYKPLTGRDQEVIDFLEADGEMTAFMDRCYALVGPSVERYIERGFQNLMVSFGCTGGRHRSVYGAEHMARYLNEKYGVRVRLNHREQSIDQTFEPSSQTDHTT